MNVHAERRTYTGLMRSSSLDQVVIKCLEPSKDESLTDGLWDSMLRRFVEKMKTKSAQERLQVCAKILIVECGY